MKLMHPKLSVQPMDPIHVSWVLAVVILVISVIVVAHISVLFWRRRHQFHNAEHTHVSAENHFAMAVSMVGSLPIGTVIGGLSPTNLILAYVLGVCVGMFIGIMIGLPLKRLAIMDGMTSGLMSGLMGVMLGTMIPLPGLYLLVVLLTVILIAIWITTLRLLHDTPPAEESSQRVVLLDKTGTLTQGKPVIRQVQVFPNPYVQSRSDLLVLSASSELQSNHPIAKTIVKACRDQSLVPVSDFKNFTGRGVSALVGSRRITIGSFPFITERGIETTRAISLRDSLEEQGATVIGVAIESTLVGIIALSDEIKPSSMNAIEHLKQLGMRIALVTGDSKRATQPIRETLGIQEFYAELLPADKQRIVRDFQSKGQHVVMVGDGMNDAPALAAANVGITMQSGADVSIQAADVAITGRDLQKVVTAVKLSRATVRNVRQSLFWAFAYNVIGIPMAACGQLNPMIAGAAMAFSSVLVVTNALRLKRVPL